MEKFGKKFQGKVAIVTASTQGIGFSIAERLGSEGASVVVSSRRQDATPHLQKGSSVIFISSAAGYQPLASLAMYGVSKTALIDLTKALAAEMAPDMHVNCVAPGFVPKRFTDFLTTNDDEARMAIEEKILLNRLGTTEDMAAATAFSGFRRCFLHDCRNLSRCRWSSF